MKMSKRPPKHPWNRVPTCQWPYKPCAVENVSSRYPGWSVHMGRIQKISSSVTEISVAKTEISVTGPARLLIWTHRNFCKEKSGEARSRKPSQPGQPGSYEEALNFASSSLRCIKTWNFASGWLQYHTRKETGDSRALTSIQDCWFYSFSFPRVVSHMQNCVDEITV